MWQCWKGGVIGHALLQQHPSSSGLHSSVGGVSWLPQWAPFFLAHMPSPPQRPPSAVHFLLDQAGPRLNRGWTQMRRRTTHFPALLLWVLASSLKPMGRGLVHLAMISTASGWRIPSQESQRQALAGNVERARDRRRLADNCNGMWSVTRSHPQSLAQPNLDVRCPSCAPQRQRGFLWDSLVKLR